MKKWIVLSVAAATLLAGSLRCAAQDRGLWRAAGSTAKAITGDIAIADAKVTIDFYVFPSAPIRRLKPAEVSAVFDADLNAGIEGDLYRLNIPPDQRFEHKNTLCGSDAAQWMATYVTGRTLQVTFFSGEDTPVFTFDALANSSTRCGTFTYTR